MFANQGIAQVTLDVVPPTDLVQEIAELNVSLEDELGLRASGTMQPDSRGFHQLRIFDGRLEQVAADIAARHGFQVLTASRRLF